jgi:hypothetical protein
VVIIVVVIVLSFVGIIGWKTLAGGGSPPPVHVDIDKVKEDVKLHGMGHHGQH